MKNTDDILIPMQKFIKPLNMNGLQGRMLRFKAPSGYKREILMIYGHHASIERMYGLAEALNEFGAVTMPDLPGFGGMESFYKIQMKPNLDTMADYLASFVKLTYKRKKVVIVGMSLGFVIVTRMLQRYPELTAKVELLVSVAGFSHHHDLSITQSRQLMFKSLATLFKGNISSKLFYNIALHPTMIRGAYSKSRNAKTKLSNLSDKDKKSSLDFEVELWRSNEVRTYMHMTTTMLSLDNCTVQVNLPVHHISIDADQYFDNNTVEQHMRVIFSDFTEHNAVMSAHAPSILASKEEASPLIPSSMKKILRKQSK